MINLVNLMLSPFPSSDLSSLEADYYLSPVRL